MDAVSDQPPPDSRLPVGDLQLTPSNLSQEHDETKKPETEGLQKDPLTQELDNNANQKHSAEENKTSKAKNIEVSANDNDKPSPREDSDTGGKAQLMVKLKYQTNTTVTSPSDPPNFTDASLPDSTPMGTTGGVPNPSPRNVVIKQENKDHQDVPSQDSKTSDPQIKVEKNGDDEALDSRPLNEPEDELGQTNIARDESDHDAHQEVVSSSQGLVEDEMDIGTDQGNGAKHVTDNHDMSHQPSEVMVQDERRSDDVGGDHPKSEGISPEIARGDDAALDDDYICDEIDLNEMFPSSMNQSEADLVGASRPQQGQNHRAIDHQVASSSFKCNGIDFQQQNQIEQFSQTANIGQSDLGVQDEWSSPHPDFSDPIHFTNESSSPYQRESTVSTPAVTFKGFTQYQTPVPRHVSKPSSGPFSLPNSNPGIDHQQQLQAQVEEKKRQLENLKKMHEKQLRQTQHSPYEFSYPRSQSYAPSPIPMSPLTYQRAPQFSNQQSSNRFATGPGFFEPQLPTVPYSPVSPNMSFGFNPASIYQTMGTTPMLPSSQNRMPGSYVSQGFPKPRKQTFDEHDCGDKGGASDDDEPLRTRVKRHRSVTSSRDSVIGMSPTMTFNRDAQHPQQDEDSDVEFVTSQVKPKSTASKLVPDNSLPQPERSSPLSAVASSENIGEIDWTLPQYEIQRQPLAKGEEIPSAKVSLPGLVREELLLSPDHADEEVHLLLNIFIPNQRALPTPDPEPAIALLNFHTITVMVIEAYVQYEIGDVFGMGRGHFHTEHDQGDAEYERMRDAVDADPNEIFFAVVDRYRAGLESKKKPLQLIRGTQEFCDVALDVIYYIKEHGLLQPEPEPKPKPRAVAADKGKAKAGTKRGTAAKPNEVQPRKKAKTTAAVTVKRKRAKPKTPGITVMKR